MMKIEDLSYSYTRQRPVLQEICFSLAAGEMLAVLGNNGAGKSTLIKCINRILEPEMGTVYLGQQRLSGLKRKEIAKKVAYLAQESGRSRMTVFESVLLGRKPHIGVREREEDREICRTVIRRLGLDHLSLRYLDELSGGEVQQVMLARSLAQQARVLLLDEPTSNLDLRRQHQVLSALRRVVLEDGLRLVMVIHDLNLALRYCDRFLFIKDHRMHSWGGREVINDVTLSEVYGLDLRVDCVQGVPVVVALPGE